MTLAIRHFYRFGDFTVDTDQRVLLCKSVPLPLTPKVFETLLILLEKSGRIVEKEEMMKRLWPDTFVEESNLTFNIQQLRKSLGDNARRPVYIETVARRGYRFIANVEEILSDSNPVSSQIIGRFEHSARYREIESMTSGAFVKAEDARGRRAVTYSAARWITSIALVAVGFVLAMSGWFLWYRRSPQPQPSHKKSMLAVLPFQNLTGDAGQEYFSDGLTEEMIAQLGSLDPEHLGVIARTSVMHYKNSLAGLDQIGRELGVQYVLEGSIRRDSDKVRITAQLIQVWDQTHVWTRQYDRQQASLLALQREIGQEVADQIQLTLGHNQRSIPVQSPSPQEYEAYDLHLRGQYFLNKRTPEGLQHAIDYFQRAIDIDPTFARGHVGLANSYALMGGYSARPQREFIAKARVAAVRALDIDESLAEAHAALALIVQNYDWDWPSAEKEFRRAIQLNPNYATAHHWYAEHLTWRGRFDEALRESEQARLLDPLSLIIAADKGAILYFARQNDQAIEQFRAVRELDPNFPRAGLIVWAYEQKGLFTRALADIETGRLPIHANGPWYWATLAYTFGRLGRQVEAQRALEKLHEMNRRQEVDAAAIISAYIGVNNKEQAFSWLEKAYSQHSNVLTTLKVDPVFDPLRSDPRFDDFLHRVGLDQ